MPEAPFFPIPSNQLGGVIAVNVVAALANLALIPVGIRIAWLAIRRPWSNALSEPSEYVFVHTQLGQYVTCFIVAMLFNTISGIFGFPWMFMRGIRAGHICRAQAFFMAVGTFSGGFFTIAIAVHTFGALVLQKRQSTLICRSTIFAGWVLSFLTAAVPFAIRSSEGPVYGPDDFVCGIRSIFPKLQFIFHLLPILLASLFGMVLYSLIFFALRGTVKVRRGIKLTLNPTKRWAEREKAESYHRFVVKLSRSMLWYPVAYVVFLVPYSMLRLFAISGFQVPFEAMVFAFVCWYLLNVVEVPLLYNTSRLLGRTFGSVSTHADIEDKGFVDSLPQAPTPSSDMKLCSNNRASFADPFASFLGADSAIAIPTSISKFGGREETTDPSVLPTLSYYPSPSELSPRRSDPLTRPRPPRTPPRSRASPPISPHYFIQQTAQEALLTAPRPTYWDPFSHPSNFF